MTFRKQPALGEFAPIDHDAWRAEVERGLRGASFERKLVTKTLEGIAVAPLYSPGLPGKGRPIGVAGAPPYRRGTLAVGRHGQRWDVRPRVGRPDLEATRSDIEGEIGRGAHSLWLALDPESGAPARNAAAFERLLSTVPLPQTTLCLDAGGAFASAAALLVAAAQSRGIDVAQLKARFGADPLATLARDGSLGASLPRARARLVSLARFSADQAPHARAIDVSTLPHHEAGASATQEIAYALASALEYLRWLTEGGLDLAKACGQLCFQVAIGGDFFMEIAKLRALRQGWAAVVERCGGDAMAQRCEIHAVTAARQKTRRDPWVNLLRETTEAFAAAVAGADAVTTFGFDRLLGESDPFNRRVAHNLQLVLNEEAHVTRVADPAGGSYYVEQLTDELSTRAWRLLQEVEAAGGMLSALERGIIEQQIGETAQARAELIRKRRHPITGVSEYANPDEQRLERAGAPAATGSAEPATAAAGEALAAVARLGADGGGELFAKTVAAAGAGATLAELRVALAGDEAPGTVRALPPRRNAEAFEALRDQSDRHGRESGAPPRAFLCSLGPIAEHKARAQFAAGLLNAGGIRSDDNDGFEDPEAAARAFAASGVPLAVICGSDEAYERDAERAAKALRAAGAGYVVLAGRPATELEARCRKAGVDLFIHASCDAVGALSQMLSSAFGIAVDARGEGRGS